MKKLISVLIALSMLLASMLIMSSCNDNSSEPTATEKPSASDNGTKNEDQSTSDTSSNLEHSHSFGEWSAVKQPTCTESGLQERVCSCGEKEQSVISASNHIAVPYDTVDATNYASGFQGGTYCSNCKTRLTSPDIIPSLNTLKLPSQNTTTVTEEQWKNAFDLTKLESFTMIYQTRSIEACYDAEDESEETEENFLGYFTQNEVNATVKYNGGNIFVSASQYRSYSENTVTDEALGTIEF